VRGRRAPGGPEGRAALRWRISIVRRQPERPLQSAVPTAPAAASATFAVTEDELDLAAILLDGPETGRNPATTGAMPNGVGKCNGYDNSRPSSSRR
jgi:hypothetical protein